MNQAGLYTQLGVVEMRVCDFWGSVIKGTAAQPWSVGSLAVGEASYRVMRTLKHPYVEGHMVTS